MKKITLILCTVLLLSGCVSQTTTPTIPQQKTNEPSRTPSSAPDNKSVSPSQKPANLDMPSEWTSDERSIYKGFVLFHPEIARIDFTGKRALVRNSHIICEAYNDGFSRREIQSAMSGPGFGSEMADDWMTLSVTYLCPQYMNAQLGN